MIFFHKPYYNPNYTNPNKKNSNDICFKPKKNTKYIMQNNFFLKNIGKKLETKF